MNLLMNGHPIPALIIKTNVLTANTFYINSIGCYLNKLQNLINRLVMNCSMNIFLYFYFSNDILFDFPSSGLIFLF